MSSQGLISIGGVDILVVWEEVHNPPMRCLIWCFQHRVKLVDRGVKSRERSHTHAISAD
ncbi:MAG: hypothetical protein GTN81_00250 [Proteobacteria bacterium]|nr:hypothetical protein [Pseudomonadota bacterium]